MKTKNITFVFFNICLIFSILGCDGTDRQLEEQVIVESLNEQEVELEAVDQFNQFLGITYGTEEHQLQNALGEFTGGNYTPDSSAFIYYYKRVDRVPISVWVSVETGKVITVFMEVLSFGENFDADLENAVNEFSIGGEDAAWFGLSANQIKSEMGQPDEEAYSADDVLLLTYDSNDFLITVAFKIYPEQENRCGSVSVNWFY